jgi:pimeloyl-ACP methyl ester carboxylesterase
MSAIQLNPAGGSLTGTLDRRGSFAVLWVHGFGSHRGGEKAEAVRAECGRRGWTFAAFDFRGHGESAGEMVDLTASRLLEDLGAVWTHLRSVGVTRLGLVGSSMGGFASAWFAKQHPDAVLGCVLVAPALHFLERRWNSVTDAERDKWRQTGRRAFRNDWVNCELGYGLISEWEHFRLKDLADGWRHPALIFHGCADDVVPDQDSLEFVRRVPPGDVELRLLRDGDHRLNVYKDRIAAGVGELFTRLLGGERPA